MHVIEFGEKRYHLPLRDSRKPFMYLAAHHGPYLFAPAFGRIEQVDDVGETLDWWIGAPWFLDMGNGQGIEMYGNA